jgi:hypothetical protein
MSKAIQIVPCGKCYKEISTDRECVICLIVTTLKKEVSRQKEIFTSFFLREQCVIYYSNKAVAFLSNTANQERLTQFILTSEAISIANRKLDNFEIMIKSKEYPNQVFDIVFVVNAK